MFIDYSNPDNVVIKHKDIIYHGHIIGDLSCFLCVPEQTNDIPFKILEIKDKYTFVENIVGYNVSHTSDFPPTHSKEDLIKVLDALNKEYDKRFGTYLKSSDFVVGEKVLVRNDLEIDKKYGTLTTLKGHICLSNRVVTIRKIDYDNDTLKIEEDAYDLWWSPEMFTKLYTMSIDTNWLDSSIVTSSKNVSFKAEESKNSTISINNFIKSKKHYQLNFNN